jgi:hypothetical protein
MKSDTPTPTCPVKIRLLADYERATLAYSNKVSELKEKIGTSSKEDYDALYRMTEALRSDTRKAQRDLQNHAASHGC